MKVVYTKFCWDVGSAMNFLSMVSDLRYKIWDLPVVVFRVVSVYDPAIAHVIANVAKIPWSACWAC